MLWRTVAFPALALMPVACHPRPRYHPPPPPLVSGVALTSREIMEAHPPIQHTHPPHRPYTRIKVPTDLRAAHVPAPHRSDPMPRANTSARHRAPTRDPDPPRAPTPLPVPRLMRHAPVRRAHAAPPHLLTTSYLSPAKRAAKRAAKRHQGLWESAGTIRSLWESAGTIRSLWEPAGTIRSRGRGSARWPPAGAPPRPVAPPPSSTSRIPDPG